MLTILLPGAEFYDPATNEFSSAEERVLHLEHSLFSVSKWEAETKKAFLTSEKTKEDILRYVRCMCVETVSDSDLLRISRQDWERIERHLNDPMTATTFGKTDERPSRKKMTSEEIYWLMAKYGVPFECEHWHLNRLMTLLRICAVRSRPQKKVGQKETAQRYAALNEARRKAGGSRG